MKVSNSQFSLPAGGLNSKLRIGVLASGGGSNLQAIMDACRTGKIDAEVVAVISNKENAFALDRARKYNIKSVFVDPKKFNFDRKTTEVLEKQKVDLVCLAGFLMKISKEFIKKYTGRIINIHPALLPKFGGKGMYGMNVHNAVLNAGAKISGCTIHFVDEKYDNGEIILQKKVKVFKNDTPERLQRRVLKQEHKAYPEAIKIFIARIKAHE
ncbi:MAG: phosphoribosylglycinamide formyltransferase [Elusimicrobia bacterium]|nr:phosphoribosylglycinamide formyltransferase [Elusimicrobiota bacterium]